MADEEQYQTCAECGATVYPEHIERGMAEQWEGKLLCVHCLKDKRDAAAGKKEKSEDDIPIALTDTDGTDDAAADAGAVVYDTKPTAIKSFGGGGMAVGQVGDRQYRRQLLTGTPNATRAKTFHCKLADGPINFLMEQINEWADSQDDIEIKFATSTIGVVEGKHADPHLIITVFY